MDLHELGDLIYNLGLDPTQAHLNLLFEEFKRDFIDNPRKYFEKRLDWFRTTRA